MRKLATVTAAAVLASVLLLPAVAAADEAFQYAAKFVCGTNTGATDRIQPGNYSTAINIHNPNSREVRFRKKVALTFPAQTAPFDGQAPGPVSEFIDDGLLPNEALEVDCGEIHLNSYSLRRVFRRPLPT